MSNAKSSKPVLFLNEVRKRIYNLKNRLYIEGLYLRDANFGIGSNIRYSIDTVRKRITVEVTNEATKNKVVQTTVRSGRVVPVIDIKTKEIREFFQKYSNVQVSISKGKILFTVLEDTCGKVIELKEKEKVKTYSVSLSTFAKAVNCDQISIFDLFRLDRSETTIANKFEQINNKVFKIISLFSGMGGLDKGFIDEGGYDIVYANDMYIKRDLKDYHIRTYAKNISPKIVMKDALDIQQEEIPQADLVIGGVPCVRYSKQNTSAKDENKKNFRKVADKTNPLLDKFLQVVRWSNARAFLIENVKEFISKKHGNTLERIKEVLHDFKITCKKIVATELGSPQKRERVFILGFKGVEPVIEVPRVTKVTTVKDVFRDLQNAPQQDKYFTPTAERLEMMRYVKPGGNILQVPIELRPPKKKFTNFCQRLDENTQCNTITHVQDEVFIHPKFDRYLTVRETARLFSLPDDFIFEGSLTAIFEMLKNSIDYKVSRFFARIIKEQLLPIVNNQDICLTNG